MVLWTGQQTNGLFDKTTVIKTSHKLSCDQLSACISPANSRVKFVKWSIVYFSAVLDCPVHLKQYSTCWTGVSIGHFAIATKVYIAA